MVDVRYCRRLLVLMNGLLICGVLIILMLPLVATLRLVRTLWGFGLFRTFQSFLLVMVWLRQIHLQCEQASIRVR